MVPGDPATSTRDYLPTKTIGVSRVHPDESNRLMKNADFHPSANADQQLRTRNFLKPEFVSKLLSAAAELSLSVCFSKTFTKPSYLEACEKSQVWHRRQLRSNLRMLFQQGGRAGQERRNSL